MGKFMFAYQNNMFPHNFDDYFVQNNQVYDHKLQENRIYSIPLSVELRIDKTVLLGFIILKCS